MAAAAVASQPEAQPGTSGRDAHKTVSHKDVHILLVDDERLSRVVVGNLLRKCFYQGVATLFLMILQDVLRQPEQLGHLSKSAKTMLSAHPKAITSHCPSSLTLCTCACTVTEAESGMEALEILRSNAPGTFSLVLTVGPRAPTSLPSSFVLATCLSASCCFVSVWFEVTRMVHAPCTGRHDARCGRH